VLQTLEGASLLRTDEWPELCLGKYILKVTFFLKVSLIGIWKSNVDNIMKMRELGGIALSKFGQEKRTLISRG
jgi:hypothetical protein